MPVKSEPKETTAAAVTVIVDDSNDLVALKNKFKHKLEQKLIDTKHSMGFESPSKASNSPPPMAVATTAAHDEFQAAVTNSGGSNSMSSGGADGGGSSIFNEDEDHEDEEATTTTGHNEDGEVNPEQRKDRKRKKKSHHHSHDGSALDLLTKSDKKRRRLMLLRRSERIQTIEVKKLHTKEMQIAEKIKKHANIVGAGANGGGAVSQEFLHDANSNNSESMYSLATPIYSELQHPQPPMKIKEKWRRFSEKENDEMDQCSGNNSPTHSNSAIELTRVDTNLVKLVFFIIKDHSFVVLHNTNSCLFSFPENRQYRCQPISAHLVPSKSFCSPSRPAAE